MYRTILRATIAVAMVATASVAMGQQPLQPADVRTGAVAWLRLVDVGDCEASWDQAAAYFQRAIPKQQWTEAARAARAPLGTLESRTLQSSTTIRTLPSMADDDYVVLQWNTRFEHKANALETITVQRRDVDGAWRAVGHSVK